MQRPHAWLAALAGVIVVFAVAGYLAVRRADIPYQTLAANYETAQSRYLELPNGVRLHYRDEGARAGPILILLHAHAADLDTWRPWEQRLSDGFRVISLDLPGHGLTRAPNDYRGSIEAYVDLVDAFARAQRIECFALVGNSMGGRVAWEYALAHPEHLSALILVDASGWARTADEQKNEGLMFTLLRTPAIAHLLSKIDDTAILSQAFHAAFNDQALASDALIQRYVELSRAPGHRGVLIDLMLDNAAQPDAAERLAAITTPTLILWGGADAILPVRHAELFHAAIAGSQMRILDGAGHMPEIEAADASADAVRVFLDATPD